MLKISLKPLAAIALLTVGGLSAKAAPQWILAGAAANLQVPHPAYSAVPPSLRRGAPLLLQVRDMRQAGGSGGCWNHCFNNYNECLGVSEKNICVGRVKTCMETCDRLSGLTNPTRRASNLDR